MSDPKLPMGTNFCRCSACGEYFGGVRGFDLHRRGVGEDRSCLPPSGVTDRKGKTLLNLNSRGYWVKTYG